MATGFSAWGGTQYIRVSKSSYVTKIRNGWWWWGKFPSLWPPMGASLSLSPPKLRTKNKTPSGGRQEQGRQAQPGGVVRRPRKDGTRQPEVRVRIVQERRKKVLCAFVGFSFLFLGGARARNMFLGSKWLSPLVRVGGSWNCDSRCWCCRRCCRFSFWPLPTLGKVCSCFPWLHPEQLPTFASQKTNKRSLPTPLHYKQYAFPHPK